MPSKVGFLSHIDSINNEKGRLLFNLPDKHYCVPSGCLLLDKLLPSRAYLLLTP